MASFSISNNHNNSSSVLLDNIDDYLAPSQACINPLFQSSNAGDDANNANDSKNGDNNKMQQESSSKAATETETGTAEAAVVVPRRRRKRVISRPQPMSDHSSNNENAITAAATSNGETLTGTAAPKIMSNNIATDTKKDVIVKASMADCLACSGCVTTAETVLMEQHHSLTSLRKRLSLKGGGRTFRALTISPNAMADLCRHWKLPNTTQNSLFLQLTTLLHQVLNVDVVIDGNVPLEWTWEEEAQEFVEHYRQRKQRQQQKQQFHNKQQHSNSKSMTTTTTTTTPPSPSMAIDATRTMYYLPDGSTKIVTNETCVSSGDLDSSDPSLDEQMTRDRMSCNLPLISGSCPALVCLVEKSMHALVPALSRTLSPMSRMGWALKRQQRKQNNNVTISWDHWAIMPCHDKKLEASRKDFVMVQQQVDPTVQGSKDLNTETTKSSTMIPAVDLVITTVELVELVEEWLRTKNDTLLATDPTAVVASSEPTGSMNDYLASMTIQAQAWNPSISSASTSSSSMDSEMLVPLLEQELQKNNPSAHQSTPLYWTHQPQATSALKSAPSIHYKTLALASGGHADYIFRYASRELFGHEIPLEESIAWTVGAMQDGSGNSSSSSSSNKGRQGVVKSLRLANLQKKQQSYHATLYRHSQPTNDDGIMDYCYSQTPSSEPVLQFGIVRGMQTMQRALTELTATISDGLDQDSSSTTIVAVDYLEAMACPHGCINGGGSVRTTTTSATKNPPTPPTTGVLLKETPTETKARVDLTLQKLLVPSPSSKCNGKTTNHNQYRYQTRYHVVPPMQHTMGAATGVAVQDMQW